LKRQEKSLDDSLNATVLIFSYGTLQDRAVQLANFGRALIGTTDTLPGYSISLIAIGDPAVIATSGKTHHTIAKRRGNCADEVPGMVFEITPDELVAADRYEVSDYTRVQVTLKSGLQAWSYVQA
jgi:gamma-glutamylcyclotransferase (GGCT)/AIG2-like uncharacterized protein YtfP